MIFRPWVRRSKLRVVLCSARVTHTSRPLRCARAMHLGCVVAGSSRHPCQPTWILPPYPAPLPQRGEGGVRSSFSSSPAKQVHWPSPLWGRGRPGEAGLPAGPGEGVVGTRVKRARHGRCFSDRGLSLRSKFEPKLLGVARSRGVQLCAPVPLSTWPTPHLPRSE